MGQADKRTEMNRASPQICSKVSPETVAPSRAIQMCADSPPLCGHAWFRAWGGFQRHASARPGSISPWQDRAGQEEGQQMEWRPTRRPLFKLEGSGNPAAACPVPSWAR